MGINKTLLTLICVLLILSGSSFSTSVNSGIKNNKNNINPSNITGGRKVFVKVNGIEMEDYIDYDPFHFNYNILADFMWKVWVDHIYDDNYMKRGDGPKDSAYITPNWKESWDVGNKDEVQIRIELWDKDVYSDDLCDINGEAKGKNKEARYVIFTYSLLKYNKRVFVFDGRDDGTYGLDKDDDDAVMVVTVTDDYDIEPKLEVYPQNIVWTGKMGQTYETTLTIKNTGDPRSILVWSISPGIYMDDWGKWTFIPSKGEIKSGQQTQVVVKLKSINSPLIGASDYLDIKSNGGRVYVKIILTSSKSLDNSQISSKNLLLNKFLQRYSKAGLSSSMDFKMLNNIWKRLLIQ